MRNDSRNVVNPEYCHSGMKNSSECCTGNITGSKIILTSKGRPESAAPLRKPVKECYCHCESSKTNLRAVPRTKETFSHSHSEIIEIYSSAHSELAKTSLASLGHETLRRAGKITYLPSSEFLRRVQKRVSCQRRKKPIASYSEISLGSSPKNLESRLPKDSVRSESAIEISRSGGKTVCGKSKREKAGSRIDQEIQTSTVCRNDDRERDGDKKKLGAPIKSTRSSSLSVDDRSAMKNKKNRENDREDTSTRKPRSTTKKDVHSSDCVRDEKPKNKRIIRTISAQTRCCSRDNLETSKNLDKPGKMESRKIVNQGRLICCCGTRECPEIHRDNVWQISRECICSRIGENEKRVRELSKFRQANYFETHGSIHNLVGCSSSSSSSGHCEFNDRIFITPHCSAKHAKRIHYFPNYIVKEEMESANCRKKRRSKSCDVSGHVVDLGILKIPCDVSNNLTLKYRR